MDKLPEGLTPIQEQLPEGLTPIQAQLPEGLTPIGQPPVIASDKPSYSNTFIGGLDYGLARGQMGILDKLDYVNRTLAYPIRKTFELVGLEEETSLTDLIVGKKQPKTIFSWLKDKMQEYTPEPPTKFMPKLVAAAATATIDTIKLIGATILTGNPILAMGTLSAVEGLATSDQTIGGQIKGTIKGGATGIFLGKAAQMAGYLPLVASVGANGSIFGGMTAVQLASERGGFENLTPEDHDQIMIDSMVGMMFPIAGKLTGAKLPTWSEFNTALKLRGFKDTVWNGKAYKELQTVYAQKEQAKEMDKLDDFIGANAGDELINLQQKMLGMKINAVEKSPAEVMMDTAIESEPVIGKRGFPNHKDIKGPSTDKVVELPAAAPKPLIDRIPKDLEIEVTAIHPKSGKEIKIKDTAKSAYESNTKSISKFNALLDCLRS